VHITHFRFYLGANIWHRVRAAGAPHICFFENCCPVTWMMFSSSPMTVKTPPMIAHDDVTNLYMGMRSSCTTIEMGDRSYLKSADAHKHRTHASRPHPSAGTRAHRPPCTAPPGFAVCHVASRCAGRARDQWRARRRLRVGRVTSGGLGVGYGLGGEVGVRLRERAARYRWWARSRGHPPHAGRTCWSGRCTCTRASRSSSPRA
jgi:hypothetical protein